MKPLVGSLFAAVALMGPLPAWSFVPIQSYADAMRLAQVKAECEAYQVSPSPVSIAPLPARPKAPEALNYRWGLRIDAGGARLGRVVGLVKPDDQGNLLAATETGQWISIPVGPDGLLEHGVVAGVAPIRDFPASSRASALGYKDGRLFLGLEDKVAYFPHSTCGWAGRPILSLQAPAGRRVAWYSTNGYPPKLYTTGKGGIAESQVDFNSLYLEPFTMKPLKETPISADLGRGKLIFRGAFHLASGCNLVELREVASDTEIRTLCSTGYQAWAAALWKGPAKFHRVPAATERPQIIGVVEGKVRGIAFGPTPLPSRWRTPTAVDPAARGAPQWVYMIVQGDNGGPIDLLAFQPEVAYTQMGPGGTYPLPIPP